jgi:hypothetical protein
MQIVYASHIIIAINIVRTISTVYSVIIINSMAF